MMISKISVQLMWLPSRLLGHSHDPTKGLRPRFKFTNESLDQPEGGYAAQIEEIESIDEVHCFAATLGFFDDKILEFANGGNQFVLLSGTNIIAVGALD